MRSLLFAVVALVVAAPLAASAPGEVPNIVSGPGAGLTNYATPVVAVVEGQTVRYQNLDVMGHDVVSDEIGPQDNPWCVRYAAGHCPLFASRIIGLRQVAVVEGVENADPLTVYGFYCSLHAAMRGNLVIVPQ